MISETWKLEEKCVLENSDKIINIFWITASKVDYSLLEKFYKHAVKFASFCYVLIVVYFKRVR